MKLDGRTITMDLDEFAKIRQLESSNWKMTQSMKEICSYDEDENALVINWALLKQSIVENLEQSGVDFGDKPLKIVFSNTDGQFIVGH